MGSGGPKSKFSAKSNEEQILVLKVQLLRKNIPLLDIAKNLDLGPPNPIQYQNAIGFLGPRQPLP